MLGKTPVIDADARKIEHLAHFLEYVDPGHRQRLRSVTDAHGQQRVAISDLDPKTGATNLVRLYPQPAGFGKGAFRADPTETAVGAVFNRARIADMDREGVDAQVIYGSLAAAFASLIDHDLAVSLCRAYNDYIHDDCEPYRARLIPVGVLPLQDIDEAIAEMHRCAGKLGMPAVAIPPNLPMPHPEAPEAFPRLRAPRHLSDARFLPLYEAAEKLDVAVCIQGAVGAYYCAGSADQLDTFALAHVFGHRNQQQMALAKLVMDGVLERFPNLRFGFLGAGCGWLPDLTQALCELWDKRVHNFDPSQRARPARFAWEALREEGSRSHGRRRRMRSFLVMADTPDIGAPAGDDIGAGLFEHRILNRNPEEYFAHDQIFTTFSPNDAAPIYLRSTLGPVGERLACWSAGYGRWDGVQRDCVKLVSEHPQIGLEHAERLLARNALRLYGRRLEERLALRMGSKRKATDTPAPAAQAVRS
jgi:predicted TIM-barrel fold metal-dependent hydrolase